MDERIARAAGRLMKAEPLTTQDSVMQLLGAKWAGVSGTEMDRLSKRVLALQREDGGWAQTPHLKSDAYATGTALFALREAETGGWEAAYRKGVAYLLSTQAEDGSWFVREPRSEVPAIFQRPIPAWA